jgi:hypothetical protein
MLIVIAAAIATAGSDRSFSSMDVGAPSIRSWLLHHFSCHNFGRLPHPLKEL